jgi:hypothetical protein
MTKSRYVPVSAVLTTNFVDRVFDDVVTIYDFLSCSKTH